MAALFITSKNRKGKGRGIFMAALFINSKNRKGRGRGKIYPSTGEWIIKRVMWKKPVSKAVYHMISYVWHPRKKQQYGNRKQTSGHQGLGIRTVFDCKRSARRNFGGVMNLFCVLIMMAITQIYRRVKTHTHIYTKISLWHVSIYLIKRSI